MLIIDPNEAATSPSTVDTMTQYFTKLGMPVSVGSLVCGDYAIPTTNGLYLCERKTTEDLLASIADGRLFEQAERLLTSCKFPSLIIVGNYVHKGGRVYLVDNMTGELTETNWASASLRNAVYKVQVSGLPVNNVRDPQYLPALVWEQASLCAKPDLIKPLVPHRERPVTFPPAEEVVVFLMGLPGCGYTKATALLDHVTVHGPLGEVKYGSRTIARVLAYLSGMAFPAALGPVNVPTTPPKGIGKDTLIKWAEFLGLTPEAQGEYPVSYFEQVPF